MAATSHTGGVVRAALAVALALAIWPPSAAAPTPAGTRIVNVAVSRFLSDDAGAPVVVESNPVVTRVRGDDCLADPILTVAPGGPVAPGAMLQYEIVVANGNGTPVEQVLVTLPLDPALAPPAGFTDGVAPASGGRTVEALGAYDAAGHRIVWTLPLLGAGEDAVLDVRAAVRDDLTGEAIVTVRAEASADACPDPLLSDPVTVAVVPPLLSLVLRADRRTAVLGDVVVYTAEIRHVASDPLLDDVVLAVTLPFGLRVARGGLRVDGTIRGDPAIAADGRRFEVPLDPLAPGATRRIDMPAIVSAEATLGEAIASARVDARTPAATAVAAGPSSAAIEIVRGPFRSEATLVGRVFVDDDGDGVPDGDEPGVPGVLVLLEDGRGSITDVTGRWHVEGVRPGLHAVRIDPGTLPASLEPRAAGFEWAGSRTSRFIEARAATLVVSDMPVGPPRAARCTFDGGRERLLIPTAVLEGAEDAVSSVLDSAVRYLAEGPAPLRSIDVGCDGGGAGDAARVAGLALAVERRLAGVARTAADDHAAEASSSAADFERVLRSAPPVAAILAPFDGARAGRGRVDVDVVFPLGGEPRLTVNGRQVSRRRIGTESALASRGIAAARYVGVELDPGVNTLEFRAGAGDEAGVAVRVTRPGRPVALRVEAAGGHWVADGVSPAVLIVEAVDGAGVRSDQRGRVTVLAGDMEPVAGDLDRDEPGAQVVLVDGRARVVWPPRTLPGRVRVVATADGFEIDRFIEVRPSAGRWRVLGLAEGHVAGDGGLEGDGGSPPGLDDGVSDSGGRVALFARGPVGEASRLTLSLDTERARDRDRLTRDFEAGLFAPVVGDRSTATDEAAAQGTLFARLDGPAGFVQWGDMTTGFERTELARYDRRLEGALGRLGRGPVSVDAFAASADSQVVRDVFDADGTSGPFLLRASPVVARSERVLVEVRDRDRPDRVLSREIRRADLDYDLDPVAGTLLFRSPVPAFDAALNPVRVVVLYESRGVGDDRWTSGARLGVVAGAAFEAGAGAVVESRGGEDLALYGVDLVWRPRPGTHVAAEGARSDAGTAATAWRLDVRSRHGATFGWELSFRDLPEGFENPTLLAAPEIGTRRLGGSFEWQAGDSWQVRGEALADEDEDEAAGRERTSLTLDARRRVGPVTVVGGVRRATSDGPADDSRSSTALRAGASGRLGERWTADALHEQPLTGDAAIGFPARTSVGVSFRMLGDLRLIVRQEFEQGDGVDRDRTAIGVEGRVSETTRAELGWRIEDGEDGTSVRSLTGVETVLPLGERDALRFSAARLQTASGSGELDFTTVSAGWEQRAGRRLVSARYEIRLAPGGERHLLTAGGAWRATTDWTLFARERMFAASGAGTGSAWRAEGLFGAALRPLGRPWQLLVRGDHAVGRGSGTGPGGVTAGGALSQPAGSFEDPAPIGAAAGIGAAPGRGLAERGNGSVSVAFGARVNARQRIATSAILRRSEGDAALGVPSTLASLLSFHLTTDLGSRWQLGASVRRLAQRETRTERFGAGVELSRMVARDVWITAGFNAVGFDDGRFPTNDRLDSGPFLALRIKFDESSLAALADLRPDRR